MAFNIETDERVAIKILRERNNIDRYKLDTFLEEVRILTDVNHENVISIKYINMQGFYKKANGQVYRVVYYVMELAEYGELFNLLQNCRLSEKLARFYFHELIIGKIELIKGWNICI